MDITAWKTLAEQGPDQAADRWVKQNSSSLTNQAESIWAWRNPDLSRAFTQAPAGPLQGVPYAAKDLFNVAGEITRAGGNLPRRKARKSGHVIERLHQLGAVLVGKTHLHEFAYGLTGENPHFGQVNHPHFPGHDAGGSSSGSAAAVAAGEVPFALGTDTAGSLRVPAAYCGLFSWRGVPHRSDIADAFPLAPSFDTAGWLATSTADCALLWQLLEGAEQTESPDVEPIGAYLPASALGVSGEAAHLKLLETVASHLATTTVSSTDELARVCRGVDTTYSILQSTEAFTVHQATLDSARHAYGTAVWQRIDRGRRWTALQMDDARMHALRIRAAYDNFFAEHDFLVTPVSLAPAPRVGDTDPSLRETLLKLNTHVSIAGRPALTMPIKLHSGLSLGLQVVFDSPKDPAVPTVLKRCETC